MTPDPYELGLAVIGIAALLAAWLPAYTERRPMSLPIVLVCTGAVLFAVLPLGDVSIDPREHLELTERLTELGVIVALMGAGLKIDRPVGLRRWATTWRMLGIAMPITIGLTALLAWGVGGYAAAGALLLGAVLAPTDPVLASDTQVGAPTVEGSTDEAEDEVRVTLTSEGGLNDALAFPFVYAAIGLAVAGSDPAGAWATWFAWDVVGRTAVAVAVGWVIGKLLGIVAFRPPGRLSALAETPQGFIAIAATFLAYGATELVHGYGFLAVFVAAVVLRGAERHHAFHGKLHDFTEQTENLLVVGLLLLFGGALADGLLRGLTATEVLMAVVLVAVIRPVSGLVALRGTSLVREERWAIAFFGIRGVGSVYYLAYALTAASFPGADGLWRVVALTLVLSIGTHGVLATPSMALVDRAVARRRRHRDRDRTLAKGP